MIVGLFFILAGALHFIRTGYYVGIVPPYVPFPLAAVYASGALETGFGALFLFRRTRHAAAWGLALLLVAVFPANVHMALNAASFPAFPGWVYLLRLPLQGVLIAWVWRNNR